MQSNCALNTHLFIVDIRRVRASADGFQLESESVGIAEHA